MSRRARTSSVLHAVLVTAAGVDRGLLFESLYYHLKNGTASDATQVMLRAMDPGDLAARLVLRLRVHESVCVSVVGA